MLPVKLIIELQEGSSHGYILVFHDPLLLGNADGGNPSGGAIPTLQRPQDVAFVCILTKKELLRRNSIPTVFGIRFAFAFYVCKGASVDVSDPHILAYAKHTMKDVAECCQKSQDAQGNTCYNVNCQRRKREYVLPNIGRNHPRAAYPLAKPFMNRFPAVWSVLMAGFYQGTFAHSKKFPTKSTHFQWMSKKPCYHDIVSIGIAR